MKTFLNIFVAGASAHLVNDVDVARLDIVKDGRFKRNTGNCLSDECWTENSDGSCTIKNTCPGLAVSCGINGMSVDFPRTLFASDENTQFYSSTGAQTPECLPSDDGTGGVTFSSQLNECGLTITKSSEYILITKDFFVGTVGNEVNLVDDTGNPLPIYTSPSAGTRVPFVCRFPLTADVSSAEYQVVQDGVTSANVVGEGSWDNAFTLELTESDYSTPIDPRQTEIGDRFYVAVNFVATNVPVNWFVNDCSVQKINSDKQLQIIKDTCFANIVRTSYGGTVTNDLSADKVVSSQYRYQYTSFSFETSSLEEQRITCSINFCIQNDNSGECDLSNTACPNSTPDEIQMQYTVYGYDHTAGTV